jgi:hypothetical protein
MERFLSNRNAVLSPSIIPMIQAAHAESRQEHHGLP